jgi:acetylornithine deacetylase
MAPVSYNSKHPDLYQEALGWLKTLISIESFSRTEDKTADVLAAIFSEKGIAFHREKNNVWAYNQYFDKNKPTILLNSHHDTVKPNPGYTRNPFEATEEDGKLYGLGSNDAGGCLVSLLATFLHFYDSQGKYNVIFGASAEEEISGPNGIELILNALPPIEFAIVGEPTEMHMAIAEKGLMVIDCITHGKPGHAARDEGDNAIYKAMKDIAWFQNYQFDKVSETLGPVKMTVSIIQAGEQHNVVPGICKFTVDIRSTDQYSNQAILDEIKQQVNCEVLPRSTRLNPSAIDKHHPIVQAGLAMQRKTYGSPTTSDKAMMDFPSLKMGPGFSGRSHSADEFIYLDEIKQGIDLYIKLLEIINA